MATHGETYSQTAPSITVAGSISGSFTVNGANTPFDIHTGVDSTSVTKVDTARTIKYDEKTPTLHGTVTVTITAVGGTTVHYTINGRRPSAKASARNIATDKYHCQTTYKYTAPFTLAGDRPSRFTPIVLRVRAYKTDANGQDGVSPNQKSKLMLIKFLVDNN